MSTESITNSTPTSAALATRTGRGPSTAGYWVGALVAILATAGAIVWGVVTFVGWRAHVEDFPRLTPPGTVAISVVDPGTRFIYLEHDRSTPVPAAPTVRVTDPSGAQVPLAPYALEMRYDVPGVGDRIGDGVLTFQATEPGVHDVTVEAAEPGTTVAVGDDLLWEWGPKVAGIVALLLGGLLVGLATIVVTAVRRSR